MKQAALHAVEANNEMIAAQATPAAPVEANFTVKALDSQFQSFGDALYSWTNSTGFEDPDSKRVDRAMIGAFCRALEIPCIGGQIGKQVGPEHYFESDAWFFEFIEEKGFMRMGGGCFVLLDEHHRPIVWLDLDRDHVLNMDVDYFGAEHIVLEFRNLAIANLKTEDRVEEKSIYAEVVLTPGFGGGEHLNINQGKIENKRVAMPEFYPYLDGGIEALVRAFVESEESVMILMGPPGTGKSSLVAGAVEAIGLLPIYAKRADAIMNKNFINFVFKCSDEYMAKVAGTDAKARSDLFTETLSKEREFSHHGRLIQSKKEEESTPIPIIVVEDADLLLAPRADGNLLMAELLNETDGIGSNHTRKIIFTTNLSSTKSIDAALMRPGRCFEVVNCRLLTPDEAVVARAAHGLPEFEVMPTADISLAEALRKPRKRIVLSGSKASLGFK